MIDTEGRHPATQQIARHFAYDHLREGKPREVSKKCSLLAAMMIGELPDGPELTAGLRKLLEAKDAFVRTAVEAVETVEFTARERAIIEQGFLPTSQVIKDMRTEPGDPRTLNEIIERPDCPPRAEDIA